MPRTLIISLGLLALVATVGAQQSPPTSPQTPPGHPQLPSGHPEVKPKSPPADPADVASVDAIIDTYYASLSGPAGQPRDWTRFRSIFIPDAQFIMLRQGADGMRPLPLDPDKFVAINDGYFSKGGYFENDISRRIEEYGSIATAFSTYESRHAAGEEPYARGINSFQLVNDGRRWWITSMVWQREDPENNPLPSRYLEGGDE